MQQASMQLKAISIKDQQFTTSLEITYQSPDERQIFVKPNHPQNKSSVKLSNSKRKRQVIDEDQILEKVFTSSQNKKRTKNRKLILSFCFIVVISMLGITFLFQNSEERSHITSAMSEQRNPIFVKNDSNLFVIQKNFYIFAHENSSASVLSSLQFENNLFFAKKSNFTINIIDSNNYQKHVNQDTGKQIQKVISMLQQRINDPLQKNSPKSHFNSILQKIILLGVLKDNGGIIVTQSLAFTEDFRWIENIKDNIYVNKGHNDTEPQVVGFYSPFYSSQRSHELRRRKEPLYEVQNQMIVFPTIQSYFVAAKKNSQFIAMLLEQIFKILIQPSIVKQYFQKGLYHMRGVSGKDIYYQYSLIACQKVLQQKQKELSMKSDGSPYRQFAIDYFGLSLINCYYAPFKLSIFWGNSQPIKIFQNLARYHLKQFQANMGPMRYLTFLTPAKEINNELVRVKEGTAKPIIKGSLLQQIFFPNAQEYFIQENKEKSVINSTSQRWNSLPKIIWIYWDKSIKKSGASNQVCVQNLKRFGMESGFKLQEVNDQNLKQFLEQQTLTKIQFSLKNAKIQTYPQTKSDLYRLALITKYGGIYMDASYIALQNFEWLLNIGSYPSQYIFNRYGHLPRVLMLFHPHYGSPFEWEINEKINTKIQWHLAYENNLIIAEKGSDLVKEWFELYLQFLLMPYKQIQMRLEQCHISKHKWTSQNNQYLMAMDSIKCVIGSRQAWIQKQNYQWQDASDYYKIWAMSGYLGQQKFRSNTNFQNPDKQDNFFLYHYSQNYSEGLLGKVRHLTKFYNHHSKQISKFIKRGVESNFTIIAHPESIFMKYMYSEKFKFDVIDDKATLKYSQ